MPTHTPDRGPRSFSASVCPLQALHLVISRHCSKAICHGSFVSLHSLPTPIWQLKDQLLTVSPVERPKKNEGQEKINHGVD